MKNVLIDKVNISEAKIQILESVIIQDGQIKVDVDHFAFTANNITYAVLGEKFKYWEFFPSIDSNAGIIPVWGYGNVIESESDGIEIGERIYGYFPMSSEIVMTPSKINEYGFVDGASHRAGLPSIYNSYERVAMNPNHVSGIETTYMIFKPLFATAFLLDDFFESNNFFDAQQIVITSASSKTAIAFAYLLKKNEKNIDVIGLTSESNLDFVSDLGIYDQVKSYAEISELQICSSAIIDFAGNKKIMLDLQDKLIPYLKHCCVVGLSHWNEQGFGEKLPFKSELFFAPSYAKEKVEEWGFLEYQRKFSTEFYPFLDWAKSWMQIERILGDVEVLEKYQEAVEGHINPRQALIMSL